MGLAIHYFAAKIKNSVGRPDKEITGDQEGDNPAKPAEEFFASKDSSQQEDLSAGHPEQFESVAGILAGHGHDHEGGAQAGEDLKRRPALAGERQLSQSELHRAHDHERIKGPFRMEGLVFHY